jgi:hypothetical protein
MTILFIILWIIIILGLFVVVGGFFYQLGANRMWAECHFWGCQDYININLIFKHIIEGDQEHLYSVNPGEDWIKYKDEEFHEPTDNIY